MSQPSKHSSLSAAATPSLAAPNWVMLGLRNWGSGERGWGEVGGTGEGGGGGTRRGKLELLTSKFVQRLLGVKCLESSSRVQMSALSDSLCDFCLGRVN